MREMYDGVTASSLPRGAALVAGYVDGLYKWSALDWALFPGSIKVRIAVFASTNDGHVLDCEQGNATPAESVDWVLMRRRAGVDPTVYCGRNTWWPQIRASFQARGVPEPHYWVADYPGTYPTIPDGAIGLQYRDAGPYDLSIVADYWPGIDPPPEADMPLTIDEMNAVAQIIENRLLGTITSPAGPDAKAASLGAEVASNPARWGLITAKVDALTAKVDALTAKVDALTAPIVSPDALAAALADPAAATAIAKAVVAQLAADLKPAG